MIKIEFYEFQFRKNRLGIHTNKRLKDIFTDANNKKWNRADDIEVDKKNLKTKLINLLRMIFQKYKIKQENDLEELNHKVLVMSLNILIREG